MWMLRAMPTMGRLATHGYYRVTVAGPVPPRDGPELIVANHTNSLLDVAFVVLASRRRVRFMTKAPLFDYPGIGWLVKAVGSVPVYRRQDNPKLVAQNLDVFRDVHKAVAQGFAVGIFPEGTSHSASRLQPLKTGAARIALGAALELGGKPFPIIPIGMTFRDRQSFRSPAHAIVGTSCEWSDLAGRGPGDKEAVRELTRRIEKSMHAVTLNLHDWQDEQLVRMAESVWSAEFDSPDDSHRQIERLANTTKALARLRLGDDAQWRAAARQLKSHERLLLRLGLTPDSLHNNVSLAGGAAWLAKRAPILLLIPIAVVGMVVFWIPREITGAIGTKAAKKEGDDSIPTFRVMYGGVVFLLWFILVAIAVGIAWGVIAGTATFFALPLLAFVTMAIAESRRFVYQSIRRYFTLRRQRDRVAKLRQRQHELAQMLRDLLRQAEA
jgi:glycerol-3-phosphate O-acyltransferase/dihydroxyacetone phosphate acyltransferase